MYASPNTHVRGWVPDEIITHCYACSVEFSPFVYKHHCRKCGQVFCHECTKYKGLIKREDAVTRPSHHLVSTIENNDDILTSPQRLCLLCYDNVKEFQTELQQEMSPSFQKDVETGTITSNLDDNFEFVIHLYFFQLCLSL